MLKNRFWTAYSELTKNQNTTELRLKLEELDESKLISLTVNALSESIELQQVLHNWVDLNENEFDFYKATLWHLTDALFMLPDTLLKDERFPPYIQNQDKALRLSEYYSFLAAFKKLAPTKLSEKIRVNNAEYINLIN